MQHGPQVFNRFLKLLQHGFDHLCRCELAATAHDPVVRAEGIESTQPGSSNISKIPNCKMHAHCVYDHSRRLNSSQASGGARHLSEAA